VNLRSTTVTEPFDELLPALEAGVPAMLAEVAEELRDVSPEYAAVLAERDREVLSAAATAMWRLVAQAEDPRTAASAGTDAEAQAVHALFEEIGRGQWRAGYPLPTLLAAFQAGARVAWRHVSGQALAIGVDPARLAALAGAIFSLVDQLSSASAAGYLAEQEERGLAQQQRRDELVALLLSDRSDSVAVQRAARVARWAVPDLATIVLADPDDEAARSALSRLEPAGLRFRTPTGQGVVAPATDTPEWRERMGRLLAGVAAVVGPLVPPEHVPLGGRLASVALDLHRQGVLRENPVFVAEHIGTLVVHREPRLLEALRRRRLAPLEQASPGIRPALQETLRSWLVHMGDTTRVAAELQVHAQTVRYRLARLRDLYGAQLEDPEVRLELLLALAWG
jgi:PucR C-terminal helix-turn-helix domain